MDAWKSTTTNDGKTISRLNIPILNQITDALRANKRSSSLSDWMSRKHKLEWPTGLPACTQDTVMLPTTNGLLFYTPLEGDSNYKDPNYDPKARIDYSKKTFILHGAVTGKLISKADTLKLADIYAAAYNEFNDVMTQVCSSAKEVELGKLYGMCDLYGTVRPARMMLAAVTLQLPADHPLPPKYNIFMKYCCQGMTCYFATRFSNDAVLLGEEEGRLSKALVKDAHQMFETQLIKGNYCVSKWYTMTQGIMEPRDGMALRVGGPFARVTMSSVQASRLDLLSGYVAPLSDSKRSVETHEDEDEVLEPDGDETVTVGQHVVTKEKLRAIVKKNPILVAN